MTREGTVAAAIENVLISSGECAVTVLPKFGGKIASIRIGNQELLQQPLASVAPRTRTMTFDEGDASGWDECLPSVAACQVETGAGKAAIPDHGDLWRVEWERQGPEEQGLGIREQGLEKQRSGIRGQGSEKQGSGVRDRGAGSVETKGAAVTLVGECFSLPLKLMRHIEIETTDGGWRLRLDYELRNTGKQSVPWSWAAHPLFAVEEGDRIVLPEWVRSLRLEGSGGARLGTGGAAVAWPEAKLANGTTTDLSIARAADSGVGDKLFAGPLSSTENWCALERRSAGVRIRVTFDTAATPYLGLWICNGGWPERPGPKQMCVALEPATAPVDSLAATGPWSRQLSPGESFSWPMKVEIERIERKQNA